MVMTQKPNKKAIEKVLGGLNYDVKNQKRAASKLAEPHILLGKKKNQREQMSLYYYQICVLQHLVLDVVLSSTLIALSKTKSTIKLAELQDSAILMG